MELSVRRDRLAGLVLCAAAIILPTLAIYAALALVALLVIVALALLVLVGRRCLTALRDTRPLIALLVALSLWGLLSTAWSIFPSHSLIEALRFIAVAAVGLIALGAAMTTAPAERRLVGQSLAIGLLIALVLLAIERSTWGAIMRIFHPVPYDLVYVHRDDDLLLYRFDRGLDVFVLALWAALFADVPRWLRFGLLLAGAVVIHLMITAAAELALLASVLVFIAARFFPRTVAALMIAALFAVSAAIPLATPSYEQVGVLYANHPGIKWSGIHRLLIWRFASDRVGEHPLVGWGMDASRAVPGGNTDLTTLLPPAHYPAEALALPLHPHNALLQLLLELGVPGLLLGLAVISTILIRVGWRLPLSRERRAGALALAAAAVTIGLLSFGIWQEWWQATLWLAATLFVAAQPQDDRAAMPAA